MGVQSLDLGEGLDDRGRTFQGFAGKPDEAGSALKLVHGKSRETFAGSTGGKFMTWTGQEIAGGHR